MRKILSIFLAVLMVMGLAACGSTEKKQTEQSETTNNEDSEKVEPAAEQVEGGKYGCSVPNTTNSFYATCVSGVEEGIKEFDPEASLVVTDAAFDSAKQLDQVSDLIQQGVKAIVLIPVDSNSIMPAIDEAKAAGIPCYVMDTPAGENDGVIATVVSNNYSAGEIAGRALLKAIGGKGEIATISTTGSDAINERKQALYDLIENEYPDVKIIQEEIVQNATTEEAQVIMENLIQSSPDLAGVFTTGDIFAIGICSALQANGYEPGQVAVTSIDGTNNAKDLIKSGYLTATAAQLPKQLGVECIKNAVAHASGEDVESLQYLDCLEVNSANVDEYQGF